jgi:hypothetical protein
MEHPELVPATDLGAGRMVVAGFEPSLASGSADLVLVDERGQLCVVEVKKEGNSDTRRVIDERPDPWRAQHALGEMASQREPYEGHHAAVTDRRSSQ